MAVKYFPALIILLSMAGALWWRSLMGDAGGTLSAPAITGDVLVVTTNTGQRILIDTSNDAPALLEFLGAQSAIWQTRSADVVILTQHGTAWQGALASLVDHGITHINVLPAAATGVTTLCQQPHVHCHQRPVGSQWYHDNVAFQVVAANMLWVIWPHGSLLVAHGATSQQLDALAPIGHCPQTPCLLSYAWQITPPWQLHRVLHPAGVLYSSGQTQQPAARLSMAQRRLSHETLWHEQLHGTITITLHNPTRIRVSEVWP
ncbi:MAG: hypothetical protein RL076_812 [Chloroflexota bacterium]|jgi:hypothetical protein